MKQKPSGRPSSSEQTICDIKRKTRKKYSAEEKIRIPDTVRERLVTLALERPELSPRELAVTFTDTEGYFVSESSVYRLLKAHDLITSPAFIVMKAASEFTEKTTAINQMWQTDFTYLKIIGWGWMYLSTILDDFSRYVVAWKLCTGMSHVRGAPYHPQTQGKIERWHQTLKNRMLLGNYFLPGDLESRSRRSSITTTTSDTMRA